MSSEITNKASENTQKNDSNFHKVDHPEASPELFIEPEIHDRVMIMKDKFPHNMGTTIGIRFLSFSRNEVIAEMPVDERTIQPFGILHGGASVALAETLASVGAWLNLRDFSSKAVGLEINANHIRPVPKGGRVIGRATPIHRGAQTHVWQIEIRTPEDKLVCTSRCTMAILK